MRPEEGVLVEFGPHTHAFKNERDPLEAIMSIIPARLPKL
jgi:hypothetical protein